MALRFTADQLIREIRVGAKLGDEDLGADGYDDESLLRMLTIEQATELVPQIMKFREEFFAVTVEVPIVSGQRRYAVPDRAMGNKLRDVVYEDSSGILHYVGRMQREDRVYFNEVFEEPATVYWEGDELVFPHEPTAGGKLHLTMFFRPGDLVLEEQALTVASIVSGTVTLSGNIPTEWGDNATVDFHAPTSGAAIRAWDVATTSTAGTGTLTVTATDIDGSIAGRKAVQVGDYVVVAGGAALPGLPRELHPLLAQAVVCRVLESEGDEGALRVQRQKLERQLALSREFVDNRTESAPQKVINRRSILWGSRSWGFRDG